jgi:hypothetical protein
VVEGGGLENRWAQAPWVRILLPPPSLERWVSGLNQQFAKLSYWVTGTGGSNPPLSAQLAPVAQFG